MPARSHFQVLHINRVIVTVQLGVLAAVSNVSCTWCGIMLCTTFAEPKQTLGSRLLIEVAIKVLKWLGYVSYAR